MVAFLLSCVNYDFVHEYGHYMQSQFLGPLYWGLVAIPSFTATVLGIGPCADYRWFEISANKLAIKHFDKKYGRNQKITKRVRLTNTLTSEFLRQAMTTRMET